MSMAANIVRRPTHTNFFSSAALSKYFSYTSKVKIVEILLAFPAKDATMAAVSAATDKPFIPTGNKLKIAA